MRKGQKPLNWSPADVTRWLHKINRLGIEAVAKELDRTTWTVHLLFKRHGATLPANDVAIAREYYEASKKRRTGPRVRKKDVPPKILKVRKEHVMKVRDFTGHKPKQIDRKTWVLVPA